MLKGLNKKFLKIVLNSTTKMVGTTPIIIENDFTSPVHNVNTSFETATFGMGCFWGADSLFGGTKGVLRTKVGYSGGTTPNPKYRALGDHTEVISIDYDPKIISFNQLLEIFWNNHEYGLTTKLKRQYMSLILWHSLEQKQFSEQSRNEKQAEMLPEIINTQIYEAGQFYAAEDYHQKYRLQEHKDLVKTLGLEPKLLLTSHVAAKLNGYLVGVGGVKQFLTEADSLGLNNSQKEYVRHYVEKNEGGGLYC